MQNISKYLLSFIIILSTSSCITNDETGDIIINPVEYYQELNVSYGNDNDQVFDLYLPANRTDETKVMILVHGGGWTSGDKADMNNFKDYILNNIPDVAVININYRLADNATQAYPMQINDITTIVNYLKDRQGEYVISDDIGFIGTSAGAHLSLLWSYAFDLDSQTKMVCSIVGPTNFTDPAYLENTDPILQEILDIYGIDATTEYLEEVSPYHQVNIGAPATILFYGGVDPLIPLSQGIAMRDKLVDLGVAHQFTLYPSEGHGWFGLNLLDTTVKLHTFIETHLN
jgi:acetyl esterase/lipase